MRQTRTGLGAVALVAWLVGAGACVAAEPWTVDGTYTLDVGGPVAGGRAHAGRVLDDLLVNADVDLQQVLGWRGGSLHGTLLSNTGGQPNDLADTLQGVDNIEVGRPRARLFELWAEQDLGAGSVRAGLYDLNSEFYSTDSAGLLISPAFGIGSELAATGSNGPSIFPSTALAVRLRWAPSDKGYVQAAVLNAKAGVLGDPGGVDLDFKGGALVIAEAGWTGVGKVALGAWRYSDRQPGLGPVANPRGEIAQGVYLLLDQPLRGATGDVRAVSGFVRLGASDARTTPFRGGGQAGLLVSRVFAGRPDSAFSIGVNTGLLTSDFRDALRLDAVRPARHETGVELTYADRLAPHLTLQPSAQWVRDPGGDAEARDTIVLVLRATVDF